MNLMSTNNSFYRYEIETLGDISELVYARRTRKALQNNKTNFLFSFSAGFAAFDLALIFLVAKIREHDIVLSTTEKHSLFCQRLNIKQCVLNISTPQDLTFLAGFQAEIKPLILLLTPLTTTDLKEFTIFHKLHSTNYEIFWSFSPYNSDLRKSLTVRDIHGANIPYKKIRGLEIFNTAVPRHHELEPIKPTSYEVFWSFSTETPKPRVSVIIPTFNNVVFLSNVIWHLINQDTEPNNYEIIIADDGSEDQSSEIIYGLFEKYKKSVNLKYIYWSKKHPIRGEQRFFRPGLARNLAARYSTGEFLLFLDSDMLTPPDFISCTLQHLLEHDIIQYQRFHINQELSKTNPVYADINLNKDTYIEEKEYWSELFFSNNWSTLPNHWKYTCTYSLGIRKKNFLELGLFKKYYVSYGFEDTDLGYEASKKNLKFYLIKKPLLHLTSYDMMQYRNSTSKRFTLLSKTAELFYLQHLDREIYHLLGNYFRFQKPIKAFLKDLF